MSTPLRFAVFGNPIKHSYSPLMHSLFAEQFGIDLRYEKQLVPLDSFASTAEEFFAQGGTGLNITVPFKLEAYEIAKQGLSPRARAAGSVNTLWQDQGIIHGDNTDGIGLVRDLERLGVQLNQQRILLIGAGGASRGALLPLLQSQCAALHIANRTVSKAEELVKLMQDLQVLEPQQSISASALDAIPGAWDVIINASSSSLSDAPIAIPESVFTAQSFAYDMLYTANGQTAFLKQAQEAGVGRVSDGLGMLVYQGAEAFRIWHQELPDGLPVLQTLRHALQQS